MTGKELRSALKTLGLTQEDAARQLRVDARSVRRWCRDGYDGPGEAAIRAWLQLEQLGLPWRSDSQALSDENVYTVAAAVQSRGGPSTHWAVDPIKRTASFGALEVRFRHVGAGLSPSFYTRKDLAPNQERDRRLIEDAMYHVAMSCLD